MAAGRLTQCDQPGLTFALFLCFTAATTRQMSNTFPMTQQPTMVGGTPTYPTAHISMRTMSMGNPVMMPQQHQSTTVAQHHLSRPRSAGNSQQGESSYTTKCLRGSVVVVSVDVLFWWYNCSYRWLWIAEYEYWCWVKAPCHVWTIICKYIYLYMYVYWFLCFYTLRLYHFGKTVFINRLSSYVKSVWIREWYTGGTVFKSSTSFATARPHECIVT